MREIRLPKLSLVVLVGASGSGKSTFAEKHFRATEVLSSDYYRGLVSDDENNQSATKDAFEALHFVASKRLARGNLTVVDATNVQPEARKPLIRLAKEFHVLPVCVVLNLPSKLCAERNESREDRQFGPQVVRRQQAQLRSSLRQLKREGFRQVVVLNSQEEVDEVSVQRVPMWNDRRDENGPFDIIGDVHGCCTELETLLRDLGYVSAPVADPGLGWKNLAYKHPEGRQAVFVGDLVDRGPRVLDTLSLVRNMVGRADAICVPGNHDAKLLRKLNGRNVKIAHGLSETLSEIDSVPADSKSSFVKSLAKFLDDLVSHYVLDDGKLVVAHAGMKEEYQGRASGAVRTFALFGETTGETDEFGLPIRHNWAGEYRGEAMVVYGHTPVPTPEWLNRTINLDTGCVFGGKLSALRYPELEIVSVPAEKQYCEPARPISVPQEALSAQQLDDDLLCAADVLGKRIMNTQLRPNITIREENSVAALEVMTRFAVDPKWLIYLPPTMSPCEASEQDSFLEYPDEAFAYYRKHGIDRVLCEEKHMGSRAVIVVCNSSDAAQERFGVCEGTQGVVYTRTGRPFFSNEGDQLAIVEHAVDILNETGFWQEHATNWVALDCELMPWSAKAQSLLQTQYAAVGCAGTEATQFALADLLQAKNRLDKNSKLDAVFERLEQTRENIGRFVRTYGEYCWPVRSIQDWKIAPFHLLATEGSVHTDKCHDWHMSQLAKLSEPPGSLFIFTERKVVDLGNDKDAEEATDWWLRITGERREGMVVKPWDFVARGPTGIIQPAIKCRGKEYLRIIYGPDYDTQANLSRLRRRSVGRKRSLADREFALGVEALQRFVAREPLRRVHECVFGVLALESEPVDPRL